MKYEEKLQDARWKAKSAEIMKRDNYKCQLFWSHKGTLNVHHKYYDYNKEPWEYENESLITICQNCHERISIIQHMNYCKSHKIISKLRSSVRSVKSLIARFKKSENERKVIYLDIIEEVVDKMVKDFESTKIKDEDILSRRLRK